MATVSVAPVVVAVDPHKASWTAAAVSATLQPLDVVRVPVSPDGYQRLRQFARRWPEARWAIEGAAGLGAPLRAQLAADGVDAVDVPAKLAARVRMLSTGHGRKNDTADAVSVAVAALTATTLHSARVDEAIATLRAVVEHRDDLVKARTQTVNRLHVLLVQLIPAGAPAGLTADGAAALLRRVRPRRPHTRPLPRLALAHTPTPTSPTPSSTPAAHCHSSTASGPCWPARSSPGSVTSAAPAPRRHSRRSTAPPRSRCPPAMSSATASPAPVIGN